MARSVLILQHVPWESPAILAEILGARGLPLTTSSYLYGPVPPPISGISGLAILGGPMAAQDFDKHPGLRAEAELVRAVVAAGIPLLGICLGHQIIATALGATLHPGAANEAGVGTVDIVADGHVFGAAGETQPVLHWHHDVVEAPDGATVLASTDETPNQAFRPRRFDLRHAVPRRGRPTHARPLAGRRPDGRRSRSRDAPHDPGRLRRRRDADALHRGSGVRRFRGRHPVSRLAVAPIPSKLLRRIQ
ncbi:MAG: type 1 glutamine amidotransferase [Galbitalea sp.]